MLICRTDNVPHKWSWLILVTGLNITEFWLADGHLAYAAKCQYECNWKMSVYCSSVCFCLKISQKTLLNFYMSKYCILLDAVETCDMATQRICWLCPTAVLMLAISQPFTDHRWRYVPAHVAISPYQSGTHSTLSSLSLWCTQVNEPHLTPTSIYLPQRDGRLSWPRRLVTHRDGLPTDRRSPIQVLTGLDIK